MTTPMIAMDPEKRGDMYYRYKMPAIVTKVEGSGNGIKTVFPNIHDVCIAINRPEQVLMRFFQLELGTLRNVSEKDDKFVIMGAQTEERMQDKVYDFILKFVLCKHCRNPETQVVLGMRDRVTLRCGACGKSTDCSPMERTTAVMATYYKGMQKTTRKGATTANAPGDTANANDGGNGEVTAETQAEQTAAAAKALAASPAHANASTVISKSDLADDRPDPIVVLSKELLAKPDATEDHIRTVFELRVEYNLDEYFAARLVFRAIVKTEKANFISAIRSHSRLLKRFARIYELMSPQTFYDEAQLEIFQQKEVKLQSTLMNECELHVNALGKPEKLPIACFVMYQEGILKESALENWVKAKPSSKIDKNHAKEMRRMVGPLVTWLGGSAVNVVPAV